MKFRLLRLAAAPQHRTETVPAAGSWHSWRTARGYYGGMSAIPADFPPVERSFTAIRAALPRENAAAFDAELETITSVPVLNLAALDEFLTAWQRIATRAVADPAAWQRMNRVADELLSGRREPGRPMAEVLAERGVPL